MRTITCVMIATVLVGCGPPKFKPTKPTERAGGVISDIHDRVDEAVIAKKFQNLHLHILQQESTGQMPTSAEIREYGKTEDKQLGKLIDSGAIAIPEKLTRGGVWAYQKEASGNGKRWVIIQAGPTYVDTEEFNKLMGK